MEDQNQEIEKHEEVESIEQEAPKRSKGRVLLICFGGGLLSLILFVLAVGSMHPHRCGGSSHEQFTEWDDREKEIEAMLESEQTQLERTR